MGVCCHPAAVCRGPCCATFSSQPPQVEEFELPSPKTVCFFVLLSYFFVTAGIAYDIINEPPAIGARQDPVTGDRAGHDSSVGMLRDGGMERGGGGTSGVSAVVATQKGKEVGRCKC